MNRILTRLAIALCALGLMLVGPAGALAAKHHHHAKHKAKVTAKAKKRDVKAKHSGDAGKGSDSSSKGDSSDAGDTSNSGDDSTSDSSGDDTPAGGDTPTTGSGDHPTGDHHGDGPTTQPTPAPAPAPAPPAPPAPPANNPQSSMATVASFTAPQLTLTLTNGTSVTGAITDGTHLVCRPLHPPATNPPHATPCPTSALVAGTVVHEMSVSTGEHGAVFTNVVLLTV